MQALTRYILFESWVGSLFFYRFNRLIGSDDLLNLLFESQNWNCCQANEVLDDIKAASTLAGLPSSAEKALIKLYNYLKKHQDHIKYDRFKEMGVPIGSGLVESTCKWLIQQRFKGVGMRWSEACPEPAEGMALTICFTYD